MMQLLPQLGGGAGLMTVIIGTVIALLQRRKISAEAAKTMNSAAAIADEAVAKRMRNLRDELWDALDISEQRRRVMNRMDRAIWTMRIRIERHGDWDREVKTILERLITALSEHNIDISATVHDPPSLDLSDVDFDFTIYPPGQNGNDRSREKARRNDRTNP